VAFACSQRSSVTISGCSTQSHRIDGDRRIWVSHDERAVLGAFAGVIHLEGQHQIHEPLPCSYLADCALSLDAIQRASLKTCSCDLPNDLWISLA
jgi:hypothetical protein